MSVGRLRVTEPFCISRRGSTGGTGPDALPKVTMSPKSWRQSKDPSKVFLPIESYTTGTPLPFECYYAVEVENASAIEKKIHEGLDDKRVRQNREFFNATPEQAKAILEIAEVMGGKNVTPKEDIVETPQDKQA